MADATRPLLLGHRGARAVRSIPENTIESFDRALTDGGDGFEFDVRITADGVAVICHDPRFHGFEIATAAAVQVPQLPRLEDVLSRYQERAFLDIELKVGGLEKMTLGLLSKYPPQRRFVVSSFLPEVLAALRESDKQAPLGLICETRDELRRWKDFSIEYVIPYYKLVTPSLVEEFKEAGKKSFVWTVNDRAQIERFRNLKVDGMISDDTDLLRRTMRP
ncbi:MAG TPA: glycerophosphodiester phosphodiesterase [Candidatus Binatia bacterium]|nr:glycerophosphodiester phosphodiesterase [Candidatus Binatia bacterium]